MMSNYKSCTIVKWLVSTQNVQLIYTYHNVLVRLNVGLNLTKMNGIYNLNILL